MKVNKITNEKLKPFYAFHYGDTFLIGDDVYMKISHEQCKPLECDSCCETIEIHDYNDYAVNISSGEVRNFERSDKFEPCECVVKVES